MASFPGWPSSVGQPRATDITVGASDPDQSPRMSPVDWSYLPEQPSNPSTKQRRALSRLGKYAALGLLPKHLAVAADFKDPSAPGNQLHLNSRRFRDLSRHTVGFRKEVSHRAILDLDLHDGNMNNRSHSAM